MTNNRQLLREFIRDEVRVHLFKRSILNENSIEINKDQAIQILLDTKGKIFTVIFNKKDGTERVMNARLGVKKYLKGGALPFDPVEKGLLPVYDLQKNDYRLVNKNTIKTIKIGSNIYNVKL